MAAIPSYGILQLLSDRRAPLVSRRRRAAMPTVHANLLPRSSIATRFSYRSFSASFFPESRRRHLNWFPLQASGEEREHYAGELTEERKASSSFSWTSLIFPFLYPALGGLLFGYDIGATSGALISLTSPQLSGTSWYQLTSIETGLIVSGSLYGALAGSILAFNVGDFLGRRKELIGAASLYIMGALLTALAPDLRLLLLGRLVYGLGIGLAMHGAPLYIAETSPPEIRGTLVSLKEAFIVLGILLGYLAGSLEISAVGGWRIMYGVAAPIGLIMGVGMGWLPPSPRWLLLSAVKDKANLQEFKEKAILAIGRLKGVRAGRSALELQVEETLKSLQSANIQDGEATFKDVFQGKSLKALTIGAGLIFFQQVTGQPSVLYYAASILQSAGFSAAADATRVSVLLGIFKLLMTSIAVYKVDELGRRPLLIAGVGGIILSLFLLSAYYAFGQGIPLLAVVSLLLYVSCYQVSFGPISWLMVSEIFPLRTRGRALSIAVLINFASNAIVSFAFAPIQNAVGAALTFCGFGVIGIISLLFIIAYVPETKGLSLEEIEAKFLSS